MWTFSGIRRMCQTRRYLGIFAGLILSAGAAQAQKYRPFEIPPEDFASRIKVLAVAPLLLPDSVTDKAQVRRTFDSLLVASLANHGYQVVPSSDVDTLWRRVSDSLKAGRDSAVAARDTGRLMAIERAKISAVANAFHVDAVVVPVLGVTLAVFNSGWARWDGVSQGSQSSGATMAGALGGRGGRGEIPALSLFVMVRDTTGAMLYFNPGGVHVLARRVVGGKGVLLGGGGKFLPIPLDSAVIDADRNAEAVRIAVAPLGPAEIAKLAKKKK